MQHDYANCKQCGEFRKAALRKSEATLCHNCADKTHANGFCWICRRNHLPLEHHHLAGRKHASLTVPICLNCHAMLSRRQYEWPDLWRSERCVAFLVFGFIDYCVLASAPTIPSQVLSEQCEETMVKAVQKTKAMLSPFIKAMMIVGILFLIIKVLCPLAIKFIEGTHCAK